MTSPVFLAGCVSQDSKFAYVLSANCLVKKINIKSGKIEAQFKYNTSVKLMVALPSPGKVIICSSNENAECCVVDDSFTRQQCMYQQKVTSVQYTPDGRLVFAGEGVVTFCRGSASKPLEYLP